MLKHLDGFLNSMTMYRLMLYGLILFAVISTAFAFLGILPLDGVSLVASALLLLVVCWAVNRVFAAVLHAPLNVESWAITGLILLFVMTPAANLSAAWPLVAAAGAAMASKYIFAVRGSHVFNPAAFGAVAAAVVGLSGSSWWISSPVMLPFVLVFGLLVVRKLRHFEMFFSFLVVGLATIFVYSSASGLLERVGAETLLWQALTIWPLVFFGTIMLTEPLTTPPRRKHRLMYGAIAGVLFGAPWSLGGFYFTSEMALLAANLYSFATGLKMRILPILTEKRELAPKIFEFVFSSKRKFSFSPGQYLEWTLPHNRPDNRGTRRYFTVAASPTENDIRIAAKFAERSSSFKKALLTLESEDGPIAAGQLAGDFVMPKDTAKPLVFIAGGIGITPFRSMIKYLLDTGQKRDVVLFYACDDPAEFVYKDLFKEAGGLGLKVVYVLTGPKKIPSGWTGKTGYIDKNMIEAEVPGYEDRFYYLSGPPGMVDNYKKMIKSLGIDRDQIKTDYFPGY